MGVDHQNKASGRGRDSVRLTSKASYTHGLVIIDLAHMPGSVCGSWPALYVFILSRARFLANSGTSWMTGPNWPSNGEIDIIEGVNTQSQNHMTMHTSAGCTLVEQDCLGNKGCTSLGGAFGNGFNSAGGGVYAMEWTSETINIWYFSRGSIPADINNSNPEPSTWGKPTAEFKGGSGCDIDSHFKDNQIVFDTTFCGDWAGATFSQDGTCSALGSSCQDYVQNNPAAFKESYWAVNSLKVYEQGASESKPTSATAEATAPLLTASIAEPTSSPSSDVSSQTTMPSALVSSAQITAVSSGSPINSANFTGTATSGFPINSANVTFVRPTGVAPTAISPADPLVPVVTRTVTGDFVATHTNYPSQFRGGQRYGAGHNGAILPEKRMIAHRAARHLQQHARGGHHS